MKKIYILPFIAFFISICSFAQTRAGGVRVSPIILEERGDSLYLEMDIHVDGKAMNRRQSWTIMPSLFTADSTFHTDMPRALINGKIKSKLFKRKVKFRNTYLLAHYPTYKVDKKQHTDVTFKYIHTQPYEMWMDSAALHINQILSSCANCEQWFILENVIGVNLLEYIPYKLSPRIDYIVPEKEVKTLHMEGSAFLDFQVGRSEILPNFRRNPQELAKINEILSQIRNDKDFEISSLNIIGYASPDGSWQSNDRLSLARAEALTKYIQNQFSIPDRLISVTNVAEDWEGLVKMLNEGEMDGKYRVLDIIANVSDPDLRENRIKALNAGRPYRYMLTELFPALRRVEYKVAFTVKEYSLEEAEAIMQKNPVQLNHYELSLLYQKYPEGSPEREAITAIILRSYPEDRVANNNALARLLEQNNPEAGEQFVEKISDLPQAYNNIGVYYLLLEKLEIAELYLNKALVTAGSSTPYTIEDVKHNLEEVTKKREDIKIRERYKR